VSLPPESLTALVLCGGAGRRMSGRDKPLLDLKGRPFVAWIAESVKDRVSQVIISANRNLQAYLEVGEVLPDDGAGQGPLDGIATCARRCRTPFLFVCPGDAPHLDAAVIDRLAEAMEKTDAPVVVASDGEQRQNLHLLMKSDESARILSYLESGRRSVSGWLDEVGAVVVEMPELAGSFKDYDSSDDLA
jgi:molybdopterin-guanine dinucleotide biosynthesis protein A